MGENSNHALKSTSVLARFVHLTQALANFLSRQIDTPRGKGQVSIVDDRESAREFRPRFVEIAGRKGNPSQQTIRERQMIPIGRRCRVVTKLDRTRSGLGNIANQNDRLEAEEAQASSGHAGPVMMRSSR